MSTQKKDNKKPEAHDVSASPSHCRCENCKHKATKFGFCQDHFDMYMAGVIRGDGAKPVDFEKKLERYMASRRVA